MAAPPEKPLPPSLQAAGVDSIRVKWTLPPRIVKAGKFASVSMKADGSSDWHRVDGVTGILGASDALPFPLSTTEIVVQGLDATKCYAARLRLGNQFGWGPDSEVSTGLQLSSLRPSAAAAPVLEAVGETSMRVHWTLPPLLPGAPPFTHVAVYIREGTLGTWKPLDSKTTLVEAGGEAHLASLCKAEVTGLSPDVTYFSHIKVMNACGWGPQSATSTGLQISSLRPLAAAAPVLEAVGETSMRVHWTLPPLLPGAPPFTYVAVYIREGTLGTWKPLDSKGTLVEAGEAHLASLCKAEVTGLSPDVTYFSFIKVMNACGWGSSSTASNRGLQLPCSDVEVTGTSTRAERDVELRKRAIDVESATLDTRVQSRIPDPKRVKKE